MRSEGQLGRGENDLHGRIPWLAVFMLLVFAVFGARLFQLQVVQTDDLRLRSQRNSIRLVRLEAARGEILDRNGRSLADTRPAYGVRVIPHDVRRPERVYRVLDELLGLEAGNVAQRVGSPRGRGRFQPVRIESDLARDELARVESHLFALSGVATDLQPRRHYPNSELAAHTLGFLGEIQQRQLETREYADYRPGERIGQSGVERIAQHALRGRAGGRNEVVDVSGRVVGPPIDQIRPVRGGGVQLTLDLDLQRVAEAAFLPDVVGERPRIGALVALDVNRGDVLALVSKPSFDPNDFAGGVDTAIWQQLTQDRWKPLQNRAVSGQYPPGSTYKAIVAAAALEEGLTKPGRRIFCPGHFRLGRRTYRCWKRAGHGWVDLRKSLVESCDVYYYTVGLELGIDRLAYFARGFALGRRTGIALPQEMAGLVPTSAWKERRFSEPWVRGETVSAAIGQGFNLATPLQLAVVYAAIANGGTLMRPRLLLRVADEEGRLVEGPAPESLGVVPVSPEHLATLREALEGVVEDARGTGGRSKVPGVSVAGKTGTSQVVGLKHTEGLEDDEIAFELRDHAWFAAFAPVESPEIAVAAFVEHGGHGGSAAAPMVQKVLARYFEKRAVEQVPAEVAWLGGDRVRD